MKSILNVVVGIVTNQKGQFLVSKRPDYLSSGGFWEFPGGKINEGETPFEALVREFREEVDLEVISASPFLHFGYEGAHHLIDLDVWRIDAFQGEARGVEGQLVQWAFLTELAGLEMLPANEFVLQALKNK